MVKALNEEGFTALKEENGYLAAAKSSKRVRLNDIALEVKSILELDDDSFRDPVTKLLTKRAYPFETTTWDETK